MNEVRVRWVAAAVFALTLAGALAFDAPLGEPCLDDAYIHLAYAASLRAGDGLSYNPADHELGVTSPLWVILLALLPSVGALGAKLLGATLHAASASVSALLAAEIPTGLTSDGRWLGAGVAGALVALHPLLLQGATSGMEVPLTVLLLAVATLATVRDRAGLAALSSALAVLARPESIVFALGLSALAAVQTRRRDAAAPALGAAGAQLVFVAYCEAAQGWPLPNTFYVKAHGATAEALAYLGVRVLSQEAWLVGVGGALVLGAAMWRAWRAGTRWLAGLALVWLLTLLSIALSRHLPMHVLFYAQRYFAIVAFVPPALVGAAVGADRRRAAALLVTAGAFTALVLPGTRATMLAQEDDIRLLHVEPAAWIARTLPADATVLVEGAGAMRFVAPRTMRIVDLAGLNDGVIAHTDVGTRPCAWIARRPAYLAVPSELMSGVRAVFAGEVIHRAEDPHYSQVTPPSRRAVYVVRVTGVVPAALEACRARLGG